MKEYKFKKGDRVVCPEGDFQIPSGWKGNILEDSSIPWVLWDSGIERYQYEELMELLVEDAYEIEE